MHELLKWDCSWVVIFLFTGWLFVLQQHFVLPCVMMATTGLSRRKTALAIAAASGPVCSAPLWKIGCIITDMVSVYLRRYTIYTVVTQELHTHTIQGKKGLHVWRNEGNRESSGVRGKRIGERERGREDNRERETGWRGGVFANHLDSVYDKKHLVSEHLITQPAPSLYSLGLV